MREPRPEDFTTTALNRQPDEIDVDGVIPLQPRAKQFSILVHDHENAVVTARQHDGKTARQQDGKMADEHSLIGAALREKPTQKSTIRLPSDLLQKVEELLYLIKKNHHLRLSMNSIYIATLAHFCEEYERLGEKSSLYKALKEFHESMPS